MQPLLLVPTRTKVVLRIAAHRFTQKKKKKNPSRGNPPPRLRQAVWDQTKPPRTHRRAHTLVFCTDVSTISSLPFAALFPLFFNTHSIIYQRFFQDIRYAARICFCPVVLASHCFPTLYKRCLRDCVFFVFLLPSTQLYTLSLMLPSGKRQMAARRSTIFLHVCFK